MNRQGLGQSASNRETRLEEARNLTEAGQHGAAVGILEEMLAADSSDDQVRWAAAACWFQLEDYRRAAQRFRELVERHPDHNEAAEFLDACQRQLAAAALESLQADSASFEPARAMSSTPAPAGDASYGWAPAGPTSYWSDAMGTDYGQTVVTPGRRLITFVSAGIAVLFVAAFVYWIFIEAPADFRQQQEQMEQEINQTQQEFNEQVDEQKSQFEDDARASCERTLGKEQCDQILGSSTP